MEIDLTDYKPSENEPYMNPKQLAYFKKKLLVWKQELLDESLETINHLKEYSSNEPDISDRATAEVDTAFELRTRDRYKKLIDKIDSALDRIENGSFGYCLETGEPIGIKRLEARPVATLTVEAQERRENYERQHNEEDE
ncbi:MAG: RNA polymerase-binding protein DksA [Sphingobacteriia bacterium]|nr:RNA polymerase-binding protein DksA [Sphingobacteriia bacterium]